ncbi:MAG: hypothetical protein O6947_09030 [Acidobacteria bacterium]|nr:hypothetical protein [Acidobacteriota bacterium]
MVDIMFLFHKDCPNWKRVLKTLNMIISEEGVNVDVRKIQIRTELDAAKRKFPGSPTIRIDGKDIDPSYRDTGKYGMVNRDYPGGEPGSNLPSENLIRKAVQAAFPL